MKVFLHYLSISSTNNLSDIGKAKLKRTRLSSSRVTKPSPRLSNATNARLMLPWFSSIWGERKELLELWKLSIGVLSIWNAWTCLDEFSRTPNCFVGKKTTTTTTYKFSTLISIQVVHKEKLAQTTVKRSKHFTTEYYL